MKTSFLLHGNPPFALLYQKDDSWLALDFSLIRPNVCEYLQKNVIYDGSINKKSFRIGKKKFKLIR